LTRFRKLLPLIAVLCVAPVALIACGDEGGDEDPQTVIDETFSNQETVTSGVLDLSFEGSAEGTQSGSFSASLSGPFQGEENNPTAFPQLQWDASLNAEGAGQSFTFEGGLIVTEDNAFVEYQGETYEVGTDTFQQFKQMAEQSAAQTQEQQQEGQSFTETFTAQCETAVEQSGGDPSACDIDFSSWLTNLENEGTEDIEGTATTKISGDLNVDQMLSDLAELGQATGGATQVPDLESQIQQISDAVSDASFSVYSGESDRIIRGLDLNLGIDPSGIPGAEEAGVESADLTFTFRLSSVNEPQTIEAPSGAKPLEDLLGQFGVSGLPLGSLGGVGGTGGVPSVPGGSGVPGGGSAAPSQQYFDCVAQAKTPQDLQDCEALL
jgi:hypothetical protein